MTDQIRVLSRDRLKLLSKNKQYYHVWMFLYDIVFFVLCLPVFVLFCSLCRLLPS